MKQWQQDVRGIIAERHDATEDLARVEAAIVEALSNPDGGAYGATRQWAHFKETVQNVSDLACRGERQEAITEIDGAMAE